MSKSWFSVLGVPILVILALAGCAPRVSEHIEESRAALEAARAAGAPSRAPEEFRLAEQNLKDSQALFAYGDPVGYVEADYRAAIAMATAKSIVTTARLAADLEKVQAEVQAARQEAARAQAEVDRLQTQVRSAGETARAAQARAERAELQTAELKRQMPAPQPAASVTPYVRYVVKQGDTLPKIAARPEIYGDTEKWPRLYEANRGFIGKDRKVKMGQVLVVPKP